MEKKNNIKNIIIIVLSILVVGFIVYYIAIFNTLKKNITSSSPWIQCLDGENCSNTNSIEQDDEINEIAQTEQQKLDLMINLASLLKYLPEDLKSCNVSTFTKEDIGKIIYKLILYNSGHYKVSEKIVHHKYYISDVLKKRFGLETPENISIETENFSLVDSALSDYYVLYPKIIPFLDPDYLYYPIDVRYNKDTKEVYLDFETYETTTTASRVGEGTATFKYIIYDAIDVANQHYQAITYQFLKIEYK